MHEFYIAQSICEIAVEEALQHKCGRVKAVTCRIGVMRQVLPAALESAFEMAAIGTSLEGAALDLETEPVSIVCRQCGLTTASEGLAMDCPACGSDSIEFRGGLAMEVTSIIAEEKGCDENNGSAGCPRKEHSSGRRSPKPARHS